MPSARRLRSDGIEVVALGRGSCDLLAADAAARLTEELRPDDVLVFVSAHAPVKNVAMLMENIRMGEAVCAALKNRPVAHVIYISSDAVYKDSAEPISESSCAEPGSLHGVMHLAREVMLRSEFSGPLAFVRPTLTYGIDDPHNGYGPNRFRRLAAEGKDLVLFGEGEEQRDHVAVDDIAELVRVYRPSSQHRHRECGLWRGRFLPDFSGIYCRAVYVACRDQGFSAQRTDAAQRFTALCPQRCADSVSGFQFYAVAERDCRDVR